MCSSRKTDVLRGYAEEIGRDPASIERTMAAPVIAAADEASAKAMLDRLPPDRRPHVFAGTPSRPRTSSGGTSTPGSPASRSTTTIYRDAEEIAALGQLLRLIGG